MRLARYRTHRMFGLTVTGLLSCAALSLVVPSVNAASPEVRDFVGSDEQTRSLSPAEAETQDFSELATRFGISTSEVRAQVAYQDAMDTLDFSTIDRGYAEDGSVMGQHFRLWYRSTTAPSAALKEALDEIGLLEKIDFYQVPKTFEDLLQEVNGLNEELVLSKATVGASEDTATGGVQLHESAPLTSGERYEVERIVQRRDLPYTWGDPLPVPTVGGGRSLNFSAANCTAGFVVGNLGSLGERSLSTAGHCATVNTTAEYLGYTIKVVERNYSTYFDAARLDGGPQSPAWHPTFFDGSSVRDVTQKVSYAAMDVGDPVVKHGRTTGYTSGTITAKNACSPLGCDEEGRRFVKVCPTNGYPDMTEPGDSGGPVFLGTTAYGIISGGFPDGCGTFMPQSFFQSALGVSVLTN